MLTLFFSIVLAAVFTWAATQNTIGVKIKFGQYEWFNVPAYLISLGSLILGIVIAWIVGIFDWMGSRINAIGKQRVQDLEFKLKELKIENERLKGHTTHVTQHPDFLERLRHNLSI